jgi:hypothetical protein
VLFGDEQIVYRIDQNMKVLTFEGCNALSQTEDGFLTAKMDGSGCRWFYLRKYQDDGTLVEEVRKEFCVESAEMGSYALLLNEKYAVYCGWKGTIYDEVSNMVIYRYDISSRQWSRYDVPTPFWYGNIDYISRILLDESKLYISMGLWEKSIHIEDSLRNMWVELDMEKWTWKVLWKSRDFDYEPRFFDFERGIMWTTPTRREIPEWADKFLNGYTDLIGTEKPLVARKIESESPILPDESIWLAFPMEAGYCSYFDGHLAYSLPSSDNLILYHSDGYRESLLKEVDGRGMWVVWGNMIIHSDDKKSITIYFH